MEEEEHGKGVPEQEAHKSQISVKAFQGPHPWRA